MDWNGVERRSGGDRRLGERRQRSSLSISPLLKSLALRKKSRDRRQFVRRHSDRIAYQLRELFPQFNFAAIEPERVKIEIDWEM
ncbi:MAG TPA: hypothetical protein VFC63_06645 [Blastocatellia bacterium]|nr:hypothetical protein [Blastocatellia bacterium]